MKKRLAILLALVAGAVGLIMPAVASAYAPIGPTGCGVTASWPGWGSSGHTVWYQGTASCRTATQSWYTTLTVCLQVYNGSNGLWYNVSGTCNTQSNWINNSTGIGFGGYDFSGVSGHIYRTGAYAASGSYQGLEVSLTYKVP
jgi:hypothetical protein